MTPVGTFWGYSRARRRPTRRLSPIGLGHLLHGRPQAALNQRTNADDVRPAELIGLNLKHGFLAKGGWLSMSTTSAMNPDCGKQA